jgi:hypothetical protein
MPTAFCVECKELHENQQLIKMLRKYLNLPDTISDAEILKMTVGTLLRARAELTISIDNLWSEIKKVLFWWRA